MSVQLERQVRRMPSTKGYRSYHGKGGAGRIVLIVLLCLILLAAVGFLVLQRYAVYGSDGSIRFDLPWKQTEEPSDPSAPDGASRTPDAPDDSPDVIIDEPEPLAKPELTELHGAELSESVLRGNADAALAAVPEGANAVALRVQVKAARRLRGVEDKQKAVLARKSADAGCVQRVAGEIGGVRADDGACVRT